MTLGRTVSRGLIPLSVFALLGSGLALHDPIAEVGASVKTEDVSGTPAVVRDTPVEAVDPVQQAPADQETAPEQEPSEQEAVPEGEVAPEPSAEPETLAAPEDDGTNDEGHGEEGHVHEDITDGVVVAELEPRDLEPFSMLGVTWSSGLDDAGSRVEARWRADGTWSDWTELHIEPSTEGVPGTEPQWVDQADAAAVRVISTTGAQPRDVALSTVDPGQVPDVAPAAFATASSSGVPKPRIITRASWGASNNGGCDSPKYGRTTRGAVTHHTAGNNSYSKSQSASIVKATQAYHTGSRQWCDIGYNFLVDKYGQIFEGRAGGVDRGVRAAHSGNGTVNQETFGISMMGTFTSMAPSTAMKGAVDDLTAWKFAVHKIPATGTFTSGGVRLDRISGHRNVVGTACPGAAAYSWVTSSGGMRPAVARRLAAGGGSASGGSSSGGSSSSGYRWRAPAALKASGATSSTLNVSWAAQSGAKKYVVKISRSSSMANAGFRAFSSRSGRISGLKPSTTYYMQVIVKHSKTNKALSPYSSRITARTTAKSTGSINSRTVGSASSVTFKGHGYGHGIGMSQYGARGGALQGKKAEQILSTYYPGTSLKSQARYIRVLVGADNDGSTAVVGQSGMRFLQGSTSLSLPTTVSGRAVSYWRIEPLSSDPRQSVLRYKSGTTWRTFNNMTWTGSADFAATTMRLALPGGGTTTYRYKIRAAQPSSSSTSRRTVNVLNLDDYTRGVIAREVPASWPTEALRAQAVAARTYGLRSISSSRYYDICDTTSCQVYGGASAEDSRTDAAVRSTSNRVLMYGSSPALTQFSSSSGGFTNAGSQPYLKAVSDPWDGAVSGNPNHSWTSTVSVSAIERANPSIGSLRKLEVVKRNGHGDMGGRVSSLKLTGSKGTRTVSGPVARFAFGLKSDWFGF